MSWSVRVQRQAVELEESTPKHAVTPGPTLPARELLGDLMMDQKKFTEAIAAYQHSLELYPRRFNSLLGASRAARALGNAELERKYRRELLRITGRAS